MSKKPKFPVVVKCGSASVMIYHNKSKSSDPDLGAANEGVTIIGLK
jgi:hypothetical protein